MWYWFAAGLAVGAGLTLGWMWLRKRRRWNTHIQAFEEYFAHLDKNRWDL